MAISNIQLVEGFPKVAHEARILAMDADGNYTSAEVEYIVRFKSIVVDGHTKRGPEIDYATGLEETALDSVRNAARGTTIGKLVLNSVAIRERLSPDAFSVTASYKKSDEGSESGTGQGGGSSSESVPQMSFECSAVMKHVKVANRQGVVWKHDSETEYSVGESLGNMIGWNGKKGDDREVEGCDTQTGTATETWTKSMSYSSITTAKKIKWGSMVGCVNKSPWKGWPARCAMFLGASFQKETGNSRVTVSFHFAVGGPNENVEIGGKKLTVVKSPFDYVWALPGIDANNEIYTRAILVSEVVQEAEFNSLGI